MIAIADSGSTKTDWRLIHTENNQIISFSTIGFNPYFINETAILEELNQSELKKYKAQIKEVFFYGAGCSSKDKNYVIRLALQPFFNHAVIHIEHDLLAAARAVSGNHAGLVAILGTGANTCLYDGKNIVLNIPALGYLLGDEGGGAHLGLNFMKLFLHRKLPHEIVIDFERNYPELNFNAILDAVYKKPLPNRFLAQFSHFIYEHRKYDEINELIFNCFNEFFEKYIIQYPSYKTYQLNLVGSVAFHYQDFINEIAKQYELNLGQTIKHPIDNLVSYHHSKSD